MDWMIDYQFIMITSNCNIIYIFKVCHYFEVVTFIMCLSLSRRATCTVSGTGMVRRGNGLTIHHTVV